MRVAHNSTKGGKEEEPIILPLLRRFHLCNNNNNNNNTVVDHTDIKTIPTTDMQKITMVPARAIKTSHSVGRVGEAGDGVEAVEDEAEVEEEVVILRVISAAGDIRRRMIQTHRLTVVVSTSLTCASFNET
tara:strand:- start:1828 stop:2220 length:393 start_codon:yes stop_codon:yes gene_type:complete